MQVFFPLDRGSQKWSCAAIIKLRFFCLFTDKGVNGDLDLWDICFLFVVVVVVVVVFFSLNHF